MSRVMYAPQENTPFNATKAKVSVYFWGGGTASQLPYRQCHLCGSRFLYVVIGPTLSMRGVDSVPRNYCDYPQRMDSLPHDLLDHLLNGGVARCTRSALPGDIDPLPNGLRRTGIDPRLRFLARGVCRRWRDTIDHPAAYYRGYWEAIYLYVVRPTSGVVLLHDDIRLRGSFYAGRLVLASALAQLVDDHPCDDSALVLQRADDLLAWYGPGACSCTKAPSGAPAAAAHGDAMTISRDTERETLDHALVMTQERNDLLAIDHEWMRDRDSDAWIGIAAACVARGRVTRAIAVMDAAACALTADPNKWFALHAHALINMAVRADLPEALHDLLDHLSTLSGTWTLQTGLQYICGWSLTIWEAAWTSTALRVLRMIGNIAADANHRSPLCLLLWNGVTNARDNCFVSDDGDGGGSLFVNVRNPVALLEVLEDSNAPVETLTSDLLCASLSGGNHPLFCLAYDRFVKTPEALAATMPLERMLDAARTRGTFAWLAETTGYRPSIDAIEDLVRTHPLRHPTMRLLSKVLYSFWPSLFVRSAQGGFAAYRLSRAICRARWRKADRLVRMYAEHTEPGFMSAHDFSYTGWFDSEKCAFAEGAGKERNDSEMFVAIRCGLLSSRRLSDSTSAVPWDRDGLHEWAPRDMWIPWCGTATVRCRDSSVNPI